jgi:hypothetical protein
MDICIVGGGHLGTTIAGDLAYNCPEHNVSLFTSDPSRWSGSIQVNDVENEQTFVGQLHNIDSTPKGTIDTADIILITLPSFLIEKLFREIDQYLKPGCYVGVIPGSGGCEFYWSKMKSKSKCTLFGMGRVPYTCKYEIYGSIANLKSRKNKLYISTITNSSTSKVCSIMESLFRIPCCSVPNYLNITLTPTNPVLHTSRTYGLFSSKEKGEIFTSKKKFYAEWTDADSRMLFGVDDELQSLCKKLDKIDLSSVVSLQEYYESNTPELLTKKIHSIETFKSVYAPMVQFGSAYIADEDSRMFVEDFPYGICIIKGFCDIVGANTPYIDTLITWYEKYKGVEYFSADGGFTGKDLVNTGIPQNFGIDSIEKIYSFYE